MVTEIPTKAKISCYILKPFYFCCLLLHWVLSSFVDPCQEIYHAFKTKITYTPPNICITPTLGVGARHTFHLGSTKKKWYTPTPGVNKYILVRLYQNKCSKCIWSLSQKFCSKKRHEAIIKKKWWKKKWDMRKKRGEERNKR